MSAEDLVEAYQFVRETGEDMKDGSDPLFNTGYRQAVYQLGQFILTYFGDCCEWPDPVKYDDGKWGCAECDEVLPDPEEVA